MLGRDGIRGMGLARGHEYAILDDADRARGMGQRVLWLKQH